MDRDLVESKLESLRRCVERIADKTPSSVDQLLRDPDIQDIIALNLQRAVQLSVDVASHLIAETDAVPPSTMAENFEVLQKLQIINPALAERLTKAVGFRNIAVHSYHSINWNVVSVVSDRFEGAWAKRQGYQGVHEHSRC
ncbi:MAG: DUF86 domain-containing protein [Nitrospira sp.]|nr:DUF86 domain-containing protein [Nitrospira sp.]MDH4371570.1 DUF86 domain-containing protein [Nitrospira sp.]MDH5348752.1 DUF86 domain-containing protein [Nitrospira sp.]MDH5498843.1 DUF86 domain-containing protein [Nitrospira sp.]MDH5724210.1 DUF86 domain-containing protein [Nitrospira sp.]